MDSAAQFLLRWHYLGLFAILLIEEGGVPLPVPGDLFIAAMGFLAFENRAAFLLTVGVVTAATVLGSLFLYMVSRRLGRPFLVKLARRLGYDEARETRVESFVGRLGPVAIVVGRLIPGLRILVTVAAGALRVNARVFVVGTTMAGAVWATLYFWLGFLVGSGYGRLTQARLGAWPFLVAVVAIGLGVFVWRRALRGRGRVDPAR